MTAVTIAGVIIGIVGIYSPAAMPPRADRCDYYHHAKRKAIRWYRPFMGGQ